MTREIGGYLELEHATGKEYYSDLFRLNLGRTSLMWLIRVLDCRRIFIPRYICESVILSARRTDCEVLLYAIDEDLQPLLDPRELSDDGDWLYVSNYYGQLSDDDIRGLHRTYHGRIIVDHAQSFYQKPIDDITCLYTCRKFFGLSDGAYVYAPSAGSTDTADLPLDRSAGRMAHILGRLEDSAREHYSEMLEVNHTFDDAPVARMSLLTENLLRSIDYEFVRRKRAENYEVLRQLLPSDNPFTRRTPSAPFAYPFYHPDGIRLRKALAAENIFVPTNWSYLLYQLPQDSLEWDWSANILPLPIDQRYGPEEMGIIADTIKKY